MENVFITYANKLKKIIDELKPIKKKDQLESILRQKFKMYNLSFFHMDYDMLIIFADVLRDIGNYMEKNNYLNCIDYADLLDKLLFGDKRQEKYFHDFNYRLFNIHMATRREREELRKLKYSGYYDEESRRIVVKNSRILSIKKQILCHELIHFLTMTNQIFWQKQMRREDGHVPYGMDWIFRRPDEAPFINEGLTELVTENIYPTSVGTYEYNRIFVYHAMGLFNVYSYAGFLRGENFLYRFNPIDFNPLNTACNKFHKDKHKNNGKFRVLLFKLIQFRLYTLLRFPSANMIQEYLDIVTYIGSFMSDIPKKELFSILSSFEKLFPLECQKEIKNYREILFLNASGKYRIGEMMLRKRRSDEIFSTIKKARGDDLKDYWVSQNNGQYKADLFSVDLLRDMISSSIDRDERRVPRRYNDEYMTLADLKERIINKVNNCRLLQNKEFEIIDINNDIVNVSYVESGSVINDHFLLLDENDDEITVSSLSIKELDRIYIFEKARELFFSQYLGIHMQYFIPNIDENTLENEYFAPLKKYGIFLFDDLGRYNWRESYYLKLCMDIVLVYDKMSIEEKNKMRASIAERYAKSIVPKKKIK